MERERGRGGRASSSIGRIFHIVNELSNLKALLMFCLYAYIRTSELTHASCVDPQNKIGHPAGGMFPC